MRPLLILAFAAGAAAAQTQAPPHPLTYSPPPQPPIVLNPLPPQEKDPSKLCTRDVFTPCPDERMRNCTRKETYRCN